MTQQAYILSPHVALRSWDRVPFAYVERFRARPRPLTAAEFAQALACDGRTLLAPCAELDALVARGLVVPCAPGAAALEPWQRHRSCPGRVMPWLALEITARCNYNCVHCFNAADNRRLHAQMTLAQVERLLDDAAAAGINAVLLTGGEPLMHPQFLQIVQAVYARGMFVFEINTNGRFVTESLLQNLAAFGHKPEMKVSFDGLGYHDWMRGCAGAEADALRAIGLCVAKGFPTRVQVNVNRRNRESILPTLELLDGMGVGRARVIPTTPSTRWEMNARGQSMGWGEYLGAFLEIAAAYAQAGHAMELNGWHAATLYPARRAFRLDPVRYARDTFKESRPCCAQLNGMAAVAADGEVYPCLQCSGWFSAHGVSLANAFDEGLASALGAEPYGRLAHATVADKLAHLRAADAADAAAGQTSGRAGGADGRATGRADAADGRATGRVGCADGPATGRSCDGCPWLTWCAGGCPALAALAHDGDMLAPDPTSCTFFSEGWPRRYAEALAPWRCLHELPHA